MPTKVIGLERPLTLSVGDIKVEFRHYHIHTRDSWAMVIPADRALYPGDMLEDTVTYVVDPGRVPTHVRGSWADAPAPHRPDLPEPRLTPT